MAWRADRHRHLALLREHWTDIQDDLIAAIDVNYGVYEGRTFKVERFEAFLIRHDIPWPRLESGALDLSRDTFRQMAKSYAISLRCTNCATLYRRCASMILPSDMTVAIAPSYRRFEPRQSQPTLEYPIYFWPQYMAAWADQAAARLRRGSC